jgi:SAM-dependent methyltransferase
VDRQAAEEANRRLWNELTPVHIRAYPVKEFLAGRCTLKPVEVAEVGDVRGRSLLHLQCHFGLDTLSWQRRGAVVTGVDISDASIERARALSTESGLAARFIRASVYDLPAQLDEQFDIVYTSIGVLVWLADLAAWARIVARYLRPDGFFYLYEFHPFMHVFNSRTAGFVVNESYFHSPEPTVYADDEGDYADPKYVPKNPSHEWQWTLGDVVSALTAAGLRIEFLREHPGTVEPRLPGMVLGDNGLWDLPDLAGWLPMMFSLKAQPGSA